MEQTKKLYKILVDGKSCYGGDLKWSLPKNEKPGKWHEEKGDLKICEKGLHLTTEPYQWYKWGCTCYEAEAEGILEWQEDKCVARKVRLLREVPHPKWWIEIGGWIETLKEIAWLKPDGKPNKEWKLFETRAAARAAACDAAWDAARDAACDAAWDAARAAARAAACDAAGDAARDATWAAARDAACDAAWDAARAAARDAAGDAVLYGRALVSEWNFESKHRTHIKQRMEVWQKGFGLLCDVDGVLYVYKRI